MKYVIRFFLNLLPRGVLQRLAPVATCIIGLGYAGRGVECPVCRRRYRKFMPYGYGVPRENALCPGCLALERHRLMELWLRNRTDFYSTTPHVLHVAPEACFIKRFEKHLGNNYITADLESPLAKVKMDVQAIPFTDNRFDVVICNHILEHVDNDRLAMRELWRVLKPGGWGVLQVPVESNRKTTYEDPSIKKPEERMQHFGQYDHLRVYGSDYPDRLREAGFEVEPEDYAGTLTTAQVRLYALPTDERIYKVMKR